MQGKAKIRILAIGRLKNGPEAALAEYYRTRLPWPVAVEEYEEKRGLPDLKEKEGALLLAALQKNPVSTLFILDERGRDMKSRDFAALLQKALELGDVAFLLGGADGLSSRVREKAKEKLAFGRWTWPHKLARVLLLEQLYRAGQIHAQHPYHRD